MLEALLDDNVVEFEAASQVEVIAASYPEPETKSLRPMLYKFPTVFLTHTVSNALSYNVTVQPLRELSCSAHQSKLISGLRHLAQEEILEVCCARVGGIEYFTAAGHFSYD